MAALAALAEQGGAIGRGTGCGGRLGGEQDGESEKGRNGGDEFHGGSDLSGRRARLPSVPL
jgi:hypothetical protein